MKLALLLLPLLLAPSAWAGPIFVADLSPENEVLPPIAPGDSPAFGTVTVEFSDALDSFTWMMELNFIGTPLLQAHIHIGMPDENGPFVAFLFNLCGFGGCGPSDLKVSGDHILLMGDGTLAPGFEGTFADIVDEIMAGNAYVNVHTTDFPGGEVRGNFPPTVPEPAGAMLLGLALGALAFVRPRSALPR